tara:strand:+ start:17360 stop:18586 length:1227 start_codon:yes stop_codon:yes gene_type:complete
MINNKYNIFFNTVNFNELKIAIRSLCRLDFRNEKKIKKYENQFSKMLDYKFAYTFATGRMCLYNILSAINVKKGDEIILPSYTCAVVPNAILYKGMKPVYVDIDLKNFNQNIDDMIKKITKKTKIIYIQNTYGIDCDIKKLKNIEKKFDIFFIEDNTHAMHKSKLSTFQNYFGYFSSDHSKMINTHSGGIIVCNSKNFAKKIEKIQACTPFLSRLNVTRILITYILEYLLLSPKIFNFGRYIQSFLTKIGILFYFKDELKLKKPVNYPARLSSAQAELGLSQLANLKQNLAHRRKIASFLDSQLKCYNLPKKTIYKYSWLRYSFLVKNRKLFEKKFSKNFQLDPWFSTIFHGRDRNFNLLCYKNGSCKNSEFISKHIINFPTHPSVPFDLIKNIVLKNLKFIKSEIIK